MSHHVLHYKLLFCFTTYWPSLDRWMKIRSVYSDKQTECIINCVISLPLKVTNYYDCSRKLWVALIRGNHKKKQKKTIDEHKLLIEYLKLIIWLIKDSSFKLNNILIISFSNKKNFKLSIKKRDVRHLNSINRKNKRFLNRIFSCYEIFNK